ncbi:unnamed protein product [Coffea canephora]|uniref:Uncharacterized protein n=1 Tax=Coffea canephora TaxID=49390 RepID=A0A068U007_COFCA|nr:unnamed protein product [Coffea canephora]
MYCAISSCCFVLILSITSSYRQLFFSFLSPYILLSQVLKLIVKPYMHFLSFARGFRGFDIFFWLLLVSPPRLPPVHELLFKSTFQVRHIL